MLSLKDLLNPTPSSSSSAVSGTPASSSPFDPLQHCNNQHHDNQHHSRTPSPPRNLLPIIEHDVRLSNKTRLRTLFHHPLGTILEYPETSRSGYIGHLFEVSPDAWSNPRLDFAYSQGAPTGRTKSRDYVWCPLLVDNNGEKVPCQEVHSTCMCNTP
jgi:hypothetical protein